ncbi:MAG: 2-amino-4-hydroxy-6-hydroxymethyldihydropteridine diphosphokinase [Bacteroidota bacterium]
MTIIVCENVRENMILVGLGSNLTTARLKSSQAVLEAALNALEKKNITVVRRSLWYRSAPVPPSDQPWFVNGVAQVETSLPPHALLEALHSVEAEYGRVRGAPNASRTLDLDLLAYGDLVMDEPGGLRVPHPRLAERAFVLQPLAELVPQWRHPVSGLTAEALLARLPGGQAVEQLEEGPAEEGAADR